MGLSTSQVELITIVTPLQNFLLNVGKASLHVSCLQSSPEAKLNLRPLQDLWVSPLRQTMLNLYQPIALK